MFLLEAGRKTELFPFGTSVEKASTFQSETFRPLPGFSPTLLIGTISTWCSLNYLTWFNLITGYASIACLEAKTLRPV